MIEPYIYQTIHLYERKPRLLKAHIELLDRVSRQLFARPYTPDRMQLHKRIAALAAAEGYPHDLSGFVRLELTADGTERLLPAGVSLYAGYALRSMAPTAITLSYDLPFCQGPTFVREVTAVMARMQANQAGASVAVRCDRQQILLTADDAPLFAVQGRAIYTSPAAGGVEREVVIRAICEAGFTLFEQPIGREQLTQFEELFYVDHRGITALGACDGHPLMNIIAERIAAAMEREGAEV